ncbi:hypothetical protein F2Q69_00056500 [Brassica cretica]|uniref:PGG domain-containing protein n=1 Tax=Brassica cretica TaxID=69181 RepID=A0A8S9MY62_BRACR|nr:hypothetical protein F2Q69_00056500 [Brassica cretica]
MRNGKRIDEICELLFLKLFSGSFTLVARSAREREREREREVLAEKRRRIGGSEIKLSELRERGDRDENGGDGKKTVEAEAWVKVMSIVVDVNRVSDVTQDENVYERLKKVVAQDGDIERLYGLIAEDPDILGHFDKLNVSGYSPMHLALQVNHVRMVRGFIAMDSSLVSIKGRGRSTPLHHVARIGFIAMYNRLLQIIYSARDLSFFVKPFSHRSKILTSTFVDLHDTMITVQTHQSDKEQQPSDSSVSSIHDGENHPTLTASAAYFGAAPPANDITQNKNSISEVEIIVLNNEPQGQPNPLEIDHPSAR